MSATAPFTYFTLGKYHFKYHIYDIIYYIMTEYITYRSIISKNI